MDMKDDELSDLIRSQATYHKVRDQLRADVREHIKRSDAARPVSRPVSHKAAHRGLQWVSSVLGWRGLAAGFLLGVVMTVVVAPRLPQPAWFDSTQEQLVADHVHSLRVGPLLQVESTDRHTVKPWFQGKLDYAPPVIDLADEGYVLLGARIEHVNRDAVAALVYGRHGHKVNLFVWPSGSHADAQLSQVKGFNVLNWSDASMQFWVVSDMDSAELKHFVQSLQTRRQKL